MRPERPAAVRSGRHRCSQAGPEGTTVRQRRTAKPKGFEEPRGLGLSSQGEDRTSPGRSAVPLRGTEEPRLVQGIGVPTHQHPYLRTHHPGTHPTTVPPLSGARAGADAPLRTLRPSSRASRPGGRARAPTAGRTQGPPKAASTGQGRPQSTRARHAGISQGNPTEHRLAQGTSRGWSTRAGARRAGIW